MFWQSDDAKVRDENPLLTQQKEVKRQNIETEKGKKHTRICGLENLPMSTVTHAFVLPFLSKKSSHELYAAEAPLI